LGSITTTKATRRFFTTKPNSSNSLSQFRGIFSHQEAWAITQYHLKDFGLTSIEDEVFVPKISQNSNFSSLEDQVSLLELSCYMRNQLLRDSDVMSMAWGLELRVPLVDKILLETISSIPSNLRLQPGKKLLVQAIPEIPNWVVNRPKRGFFFPFQQWIESDWHDYFPSPKLDKNIDIRLWYRRWSLAIFQFWLKQIYA
jgi:Asparagine synthase.